MLNHSEPGEATVVGTRGPRSGPRTALGESNLPSPIKGGDFDVAPLAYGAQPPKTTGHDEP